MNMTPHLIIESGPEKGRELTIAQAGSTIGRSSQSDISVKDPLLSRKHCRFDLREGDLWIKDLESANETWVNDVTITEKKLSPGDSILIGDTVLRVKSGAATPAASGEHGAAAGAVNPDTETAPAPLVDLGFAPEEDEAPEKKQDGVSPLLWVTAILVGILVIFYGVYTTWFATEKPEQETKPIVKKEPDTLRLIYEKVEATDTNIFRYFIEVTPDMRISCKIDDVKNNRHIRKSTLVESNQFSRLIDNIRDNGFFSLKEEYSGIREGELERHDMTVIIGKNVHRCLISNHSQPERFEAIRSFVDDFAKSELGIWALQISEPELIERASQTYRNARRLYDDRNIDYGNLSRALTAYREAELYLETVDPKPTFYREIAEHAKRAEEEINRLYSEMNVTFEREMRLKHWEAAAAQLRILIQIIPDRSDPRHDEIRRQLNEAESRIKGSR